MKAIPATDKTLPAVTRVFHDMPAVSRAFGGAGSGNFGHAGRPGEVGGSAPGEGGGSSSSDDDDDIDTAPAPPGSYTRPVPIRVKSIDEAIDLVRQGKTVELPDVNGVATMIDKLAEMTIAAQKAGKDAPNINLCHVTVRNTNLFCEDMVRTAKHPKGLDRIIMPQFEAEPEPGSPADKLEKNSSGLVNAGPAFLDHLKSLGIATKTGKVSSASLKASQDELIGAKIAMQAKGKAITPESGTIWISRDFYVIDGHHRWAGSVAQDARDGKLGESKMRVVMVDAPITEVLHLAKQWTKTFGLRGAAGTKKK